MTDNTTLIAEARQLHDGVQVTYYDAATRTFKKGPSIVERLADALEAAERSTQAHDERVWDAGYEAAARYHEGEALPTANPYRVKEETE